MARGNRRLVYDVNNRGTKLLVHFLNDAPQVDDPTSVEDAGNGFLMRRGYTVLWSGWQGDILSGDNRMAMRLPVASMNGSPITGPVRTEFSPGDALTKLDSASTIVSMPLSGNAYTSAYTPASLDTTEALFTYRNYETDPRIPIPPEAWQFAKPDASGNPIPSPTDVYLPEGFKPGWIYELVYTAKDPLVMGLGFTGLRDLISFLLNADADSSGQPNPVRDNGAGIEKAYGWGCSQSARFLREFTYRGFNEDAEGRQVFAGISPFVSGGGRVFVNYRFSQPGRYPRQHYDHLYPSDQFPHAYSITTDAITGKTDGILSAPRPIPSSSTPSPPPSTGSAAAPSSTPTPSATTSQTTNAHASTFSPPQSTAPTISKAPTTNPSSTRPTPSTSPPFSALCSTTSTPGLPTALHPPAAVSPPENLRPPSPPKVSQPHFHQFPASTPRQRPIDSSSRTTARTSIKASFPLSRQWKTRAGNITYWFPRSTRTATTYQASAARSSMCRLPPIPVGTSGCPDRRRTPWPPSTVAICPSPGLRKSVLLTETLDPPLKNATAPAPAMSDSSHWPASACSKSA